MFGQRQPEGCGMPGTENSSQFFCQAASMTLMCHSVRRCGAIPSVFEYCSVFSSTGLGLSLRRHADHTLGRRRCA